MISALLLYNRSNISSFICFHCMLGLVWVQLYMDCVMSS